MLKAGEELITLSNNKEYSVVSSIIYEGSNYVCLIDTDSYKDYKFCLYENDELIVVKDHDLIEVLISKFNSDLKTNIAKIINQD